VHEQLNWHVSCSVCDEEAVLTIIIEYEGAHAQDTVRPAAAGGLPSVPGMAGRIADLLATGCIKS
jgi:hypothetical protein